MTAPELSNQLKRLARRHGFELAGAAAVGPLAEHREYSRWAAAGYAGAMGYLTDHRAGLRADVRNLLPTAKSVFCVGKLYNAPVPHSTAFDEAQRGWISRYAWGDDYHLFIRRGLERLVHNLQGVIGENFEWRICVDTAPVLERAWAHRAGLGWIGKNTCLLNEPLGSWFFLGEVLLSLELVPDLPPPDRCGSCTRCIEACPTQALIPGPDGEGPAWVLDSRRCISYHTIELRTDIPGEHRAGIGRHVFGCDICQEVCPWNSRAPVTEDPACQPREVAPDLDRLAALTEPEFRQMFRSTPVSRAKYRGFLRNVAVAMGNAGDRGFLPVLERLADHADAMVARHAQWAMRRIENGSGEY